LIITGLVDLGRPVIPPGITGMNTLNLEQAAELLKLYPQTVLQRARSGEIPAAKPGKCWVFIEEDLIIWLRSLYNKGGDARQGGQALCSLKEKTRSYGGTNTKPQTAKLYANLLGQPTNDRLKS
jgi:excisionase family DNA binding protein